MAALAITRRESVSLVCVALAGLLLPTPLLNLLKKIRRPPGPECPSELPPARTLNNPGARAEEMPHSSSQLTTKT